MIRLTLICCASTAATRRSAFPWDDALDARGREEAKAVAGEIRAPDRALASPASSARETAGLLGLVATEDPLLREVDYGAWRGRTIAEVSAENADGIALWMDDPAAAPHGGESLTDLFARVDRWLAARSGEAEKTAAVTHAAVIRAAIVLALGAPISAFWRIDIPPLSRTVLHGDSNHWRLRSLIPPRGA